MKRLVQINRASNGVKRMALFLGYDPGGSGRNGVAAARIREDGTVLGEPTIATVRDAAEVLEWIGEFPEGVALGIDTLAAWSLTGGRRCDDALRTRYSSKSVTAQNSLYSAMTVNGMMVAMAAQERGLRLCESHPKLFLRVVPTHDPESIDVCRRHAMIKSQGADGDHMADALVAAWCASRCWHRKWSHDLFDLGRDQLVFPAGAATYPWPVDLSSTS